MTKVYCADVSCMYNDNQRCTNKMIKIAYLFRGSLPGSIEDKEFHKCRSYEPSDFTIRMKQYLEDRADGHPISQK